MLLVVQVGLRCCLELLVAKLVLVWLRGLAALLDLPVVAFRLALLMLVRLRLFEDLERALLAARAWEFVALAA